MKIRSFLFFIFISSLISCDMQEESTPSESQEELIPIIISMDKELHTSESSLHGRKETSEMSTAQDTLNDLFAFQVYDENGYPYAYVVGDDIKKIVLELSNGQEYGIQVTYIEKGKNIVKKDPDSDATFGMPFSTYNSGPADLNKVYYGSENHLAYLGWYNITSEGPIIHQRHTQANRYYYFIKFEPSPEKPAIAINLKRISIGINLEIDLGQETELEHVIFTPEKSNSYIIHLENGKGFLHIPYLTIPGDEGLRALDEIVKMDHAEDFTFTIGTEERPHHFYAGRIKVKRNTIYNLTASYQTSVNKRNINIDQKDHMNLKVEVQAPNF